MAEDPTAILAESGTHAEDPTAILVESGDTYGAWMLGCLMQNR